GIGPRGMVMAGTATKRRSGSHRHGGRSRTRAASRRTAKARGGRRWSRRVTEESDALTLEQGVFTMRDPKRIAASLKRSAERSRRRKNNAYRSALSMLTFYINRAGKNLPATRKRALMRAKDELRKPVGRPGRDETVIRGLIGTRIVRALRFAPSGLRCCRRGGRRCR